MNSDNIAKISMETRGQRHDAFAGTSGIIITDAGMRAIWDGQRGIEPDEPRWDDMDEERQCELAEQVEGFIVNELANSFRFVDE